MTGSLARRLRRPDVFAYVAQPRRTPRAR